MFEVSFCYTFSMKTYTLTKIPADTILYFSITCGLMPGYKNQKPYSFDKAQLTYQHWIQERLEQNLPIFAATLTESSLVYGFRNESNEIVNNTEPAVLINGEIIRGYCPTLFDNHSALLDIVVELASKLGTELDQERVHIMFNNQKYILG